MPIYALGDAVPSIHPTAFVHPEAVIIGDVAIGELASIWPGAVLRGDEGYIRIGARTSIQDNSVLHTTPLWPTVVGDGCTIGHIVHLEGCTVEDGCLIGNGSMVLHRCVVQTGSIVAANSVVLNDTVVPAGSLAVGTPATIKVGRANAQLIAQAEASYTNRARTYPSLLRRIS